MLKKGGFFWTIVIILVLFGIIDSYLLINKFYLNEKNNNSILNINKNTSTATFEDDNINKTTQNSSESGGASGGSGTAGTANTGGTEESSELPTNVSCDSQIAYSLEYLDVEETCNQEISEECLRKTVTCSLTVNNFDEQVSGVFEIRFNFIEKGDKLNNSFASVKVSDIIYAKSYKIFKAGTLISESSGNANKTITCAFSTLKVPKKNIC